MTSLDELADEVWAALDTDIPEHKWAPAYIALTTLLTRAKEAEAEAVDISAWKVEAQYQADRVIEAELDRGRYREYYEAHRAVEEGVADFKLHTTVVERLRQALRDVEAGGGDSQEPGRTREVASTPASTPTHSDTEEESAVTYRTCAVCGKWIWFDYYGPGWVHKNRGIFGADGHFATTFHSDTEEGRADSKGRIHTADCTFENPAKFPVCTCGTWPLLKLNSDTEEGT